MDEDERVAYLLGFKELSYWRLVGITQLDTPADFLAWIWGGGVGGGGGAHGLVILESYW